MSETNGKPGAATTPEVPQADHDAAVATARAEGETAGAKAANERFAAILGAEGIKGDGKRMAAAFDLAVKSPGMSAEDVCGFIAGNVTAAADDADPVAAYERGRAGAVIGQIDAAGAARPGREAKPAATINRSEIFARRQQQEK